MTVLPAVYGPALVTTFAIAKSYVPGSITSIVATSSSSSSPLPSPSSSTVSSVVGSLSTSSPSSDVICVLLFKDVPSVPASIVNVKATVSVVPATNDATSNVNGLDSVTFAFIPASLDTYVNPESGTSTN